VLKKRWTRGKGEGERGRRGRAEGRAEEWKSRRRCLILNPEVSSYSRFLVTQKSKSSYSIIKRDKDNVGTICKEIS
jgi:hypothetical protein